MSTMLPSQSPDRGPIKFSLVTALLGGAAAIGAIAFFGTLVANISLWLAIGRGLSLQQAYAEMGSSFVSPSALLSLLVQILSAAAGGYVSALYGRGRHLLQGAAAGGISVLFMLVMHLGPGGQPNPSWYVALTLVIPPVSGFVGGYVYARRI